MKIKNNYSRLSQARFQQKQLQEKEQKLLQLYDQQQQRAYQVVQRGSAGSNGSNHGSISQHTVTRTSTSSHATSTSQGGKVSDSSRGNAITCRNAVSLYAFFNGAMATLCLRAAIHSFCIPRSWLHECHAFSFIIFIVIGDVIRFQRKGELVESMEKFGKF